MMMYNKMDYILISSVWGEALIAGIIFQDSQIDRSSMNIFIEWLVKQFALLRIIIITVFIILIIILILLLLFIFLNQSHHHHHHFSKFILHRTVNISTNCIIYIHWHYNLLNYTQSKKYYIMQVHFIYHFFTFFNLVNLINARRMQI